MNNEKILAMKAGRRLDKLIATEIFGYKVQRRYGFWDECGYFTDMQSNPYSRKGTHHKAELCILTETRELTENEIAAYKEDIEKGIAHFMPKRADFCERLPEYSTDILATWSVLARLHKDYWCIEIKIADGCCVIMELLRTPPIRVEVNAGTPFEQLPKAICKAALLAKAKQLIDKGAQ